jgi:hypothetical protein
MVLHDINVCTIINVLQNSRYNETRLFSDENFITEVDRKSTLYYSKYNDDSRTKEEVIKDVLIGEMGEHAILKLCQEAGLKAEHNDEELTKEFHWDLLIEGLKVEIKFQGNGFSDLHPRKFFSFNNKKKEGLMFSHWRYYDLIISFYIKEDGFNHSIVPCFLIDSSVMDPTNLAYDGEPYYRPSKFGGNYLDFKAEKAGLMKRLNFDQNKYSK